MNILKKIGARIKAVFDSPAKMLARLTKAMDEIESNPALSFERGDSVISKLESGDPKIAKKAFKELRALEAKGLTPKEIVIAAGALKQVKVSQAKKVADDAKEFQKDAENALKKVAKVKKTPKSTEAVVKQARQAFEQKSALLTDDRLAKSISNLSGELKELTDAVVSENGSSYYSSKLTSWLRRGGSFSLEGSILLSSDRDEFLQNIDTLDKFFEYGKTIDKMKSSNRKQELAKIASKYGISTKGMEATGEENPAMQETEAMKNFNDYNNDDNDDIM